VSDVLHTFVYGLHEGDHDFWYVGMTKDPTQRLRQHRLRNPRFTPDTQLHVIEEVTGTLDEVRPVEQEWIDGLRAVGYPLVNKEGTPPYSIQTELTEAHRRKLSKAANNPSAETRQRISDAMRGRKASDDAKRKMSESQRGLKPSDVTRRKMSESQLRRRAFERQN
jgi:hypothetical protein